MRAVTVGVKVIAMREGQVLLVRQTYRRGWYLPGGGAKPGESLEAAARRELGEETGVRAGPLRLVGVYSGSAHGVTDHIALFAADARGEGRAESWEVAEARWFPLHELPPLLAHADRLHLERFRDGVAERHGPW